MKEINGLFLRLSIAICLYVILTLPYITYFFFDFGVDYGKYGCMFCGFITIILAPIVQKKLRLE